MKAMILAAGKGTRLGKITEKIPKALLDIDGKPFIARQLSYLKRQGIEKVVLCVSYLGEKIETYVRDGSDFDIEILYSYDDPEMLGTGGALINALPLLGNHFFVLYGDSYLPIDYGTVEEAYLASGKPALMTVMRNADRWDKSNIIFSSGIIREYNKRQPKPEMEYIDYGLGALSADVFRGYCAGERIDLAAIYHRLSIQGDLAGFEVFERFYEIGSHQGLQETIDYFKKGGER